MISIGNDIIDLQQTNPERTAQEKFYLKIICKKEAELFKNIDSTLLLFEHFVWLAWSVKESVYKFYKRHNPGILFSPTKIIINKIGFPIQKVQSFHRQKEAFSFLKEECYCCKVIFDSNTFFTRTLLQDGFIFTVANNMNDFENIYWGIKSVDDDDSYSNQSKIVREFVLKKLNTIFLPGELTIEKSGIGYPFLKQQKNLPLSFSHHGNFAAYAFAL